MTRPKSSEEPPRRSRPRAKTSEAREQQLIAAAIDLAERQIQEGRVSAQVLTHYLKLGSEREKLERAKLQQENALLRARVEDLASNARNEEMYAAELKAMRTYTGQDVSDDEDY